MQVKAVCLSSTRTPSPSSYPLLYILPQTPLPTAPRTSVSLISNFSPSLLFTDLHFLRTSAGMGGGQEEGSQKEGGGDTVNRLALVAHIS